VSDPSRADLALSGAPADDMTVEDAVDEVNFLVAELAMALDRLERVADAS
jgi:hypothetical protein